MASTTNPVKTFIDPSFSVSEDDLKHFQEKGFLLLKGFFSKELIQYIIDKIESELSSPTDKYQSGFNRVRYDLFEYDAAIKGLMEDRAFRDQIKKLTERQMIFTHALAFELNKGVSKGFPWHIGTQSFGFQRAEDFGCTIWTPLIPIDPKGQRGGMAYVPKNKVSGDFMYTHVDPASFACLEERIQNHEEIFIEEFMLLRDGPLNDPGMKKLLDYYAVEDTFELGDAILFDKYVIHRSVMLEDGPFDSRLSIAMRFADADSHYDLKRALDLEIPRKYWNYAGPTKFHLNVGNEDGQLLRDSPLFADSLQSRLLV